MEEELAKRKKSAKANTEFGRKQKLILAHNSGPCYNLYEKMDVKVPKTKTILRKSRMTLPPHPCTTYGKADKTNTRTAKKRTEDLNVQLSSPRENPHSPRSRSSQRCAKMMGTGRKAFQVISYNDSCKSEDLKVFLDTEACEDVLIWKNSNTCRNKLTKNEPKGFEPEESEDDSEVLGYIRGQRRRKARGENISGEELYIEEATGKYRNYHHTRSVSITLYNDDPQYDQDFGKASVFHPIMTLREKLMLGIIPKPGWKKVEKDKATVKTETMTVVNPNNDAPLSSSSSSGCHYDDDDDDDYEDYDDLETCSSDDDAKDFKDESEQDLEENDMNKVSYCFPLNHEGSEVVISLTLPKNFASSELTFDSPSVACQILKSARDLIQKRSSGGAEYSNSNSSRRSSNDDDPEQKLERSIVPITSLVDIEEKVTDEGSLYSVEIEEIQTDEESQYSVEIEEIQTDEESQYSVETEEIVSDEELSYSVNIEEIVSDEELSYSVNIEEIVSDEELSYSVNIEEIVSDEDLSYSVNIEEIVSDEESPSLVTPQSSTPEGSRGVKIKTRSVCSSRPGASKSKSLALDNCNLDRGDNAFMQPLCNQSLALVERKSVSNEVGVVLNEENCSIQLSKRPSYFTPIKSLRAFICRTFNCSCIHKRNTIT